MEAHKSPFTNACENLWSDLFSKPTHLDSLLSKQTKSLKSLLAIIVPPILLRPASLAEAIGVGVPPNEPWTLNKSQLVSWRPAFSMMKRMEELRAQQGDNFVVRLMEAKAILEDFPPRMIAEWRSELGEEGAAKLISILAKPAALSLRAYKKMGAAELLAKLTEGSRLPVRASLSKISPLGVKLDGYVALFGTELFQKGNFEIQDEGSQFMALFAMWPEVYGKYLQDIPGMVPSMVPDVVFDKVNITTDTPELSPAVAAKMTVVDACAGAGGKTLALADLLKGKGRMFAYDTSEKKLQSLRKRATRAGLNNIQAVSVVEDQEGAVVDRFKKKAQIVLVDAPCTGWGVLRRNPDIKWRQSEDVLDRMPKLQTRLLSLYSELVAPGGKLTYGVCTFRKAETRGVIEGFLKDHPEFEAKEGGYLGPGPCDGYFMQSLLRGK